MQAHEIRAIAERLKHQFASGTKVIESEALLYITIASAAAQIEIAAQLAELNDKLQLLSMGNAPDSFRSLAVTLLDKEKEEEPA